MNITSLFEEHKSLGAKIVDFAGWQMPIQYENLKKEVQAVRENVGVFDVSHMGEFFIFGTDAIEAVDYIVTNDISNAKTGKAIYSPMCREDGTIIDDLIVYKISDSRVMICVNAANIDKDKKWIKEKISKFNVEFADQSANYSLLAVQGPNSYEVLNSIELDFKIEDIEYYSLQIENQDSSIPTIIARTGYTGEDGFEIFAPHSQIKNIWNQLINKGVTPCGLGARDVLRLEVCYPLYGNELNDEVTPLDCGLKWTVKFNKKDFIGKNFLKTYAPKYQLIKLVLDKGIAREGYLVEDSQGNQLGIITSGTMSVVNSKGIALARVNKDADIDSQIFINIRNRQYEAKRIKNSFVTGGHK